MTVLPPITNILDLEQLEEGVFEGPPVADGRSRVFGGQVIAQALAAASFTVEGWPCHSLHSYFLRPGKPGRPIYYEVTELRDARRLCSRQVLAIQRDEPIVQLTASFQADDGEIASFQPGAPEVPRPDALPDEEAQRAWLRTQLPEDRRAYADLVWPFELRAVEQVSWFASMRQPMTRHVWFRCRDSLPEYANLHRAALSYASDLFPLQSCVMATPVSAFDPDLQLASLDHSLWFHRDFRADEWMLYVGDCASVANGRGLGQGRIFDADGTLIASVAQEGLVHRPERG